MRTIFAFTLVFAVTSLCAADGNTPSGVLFVDAAASSGGDGSVGSAVPSRPHSRYNEIRHCMTRQLHDVRAFGAKGDGVTKDTVAIQKAIDAAAIRRIRRMPFPGDRAIVENVEGFDRTGSSFRLLTPEEVKGMRNAYGTPWE